MPSSVFFRHAGLFVMPGFLNRSECLDVQARMRGAQPEKALIAKKSGGGRAETLVDENWRKVASINVDKSTATWVKERLLEVRPKLEEHFKIPLTGCQGPDFLNYGENSFYKRHKDVDSDAPPAIIHRKVSAVIFLNAVSNTPASGCYTGGSLAFFGLLPGPEWMECAFPLEAEAGLLIAFPSDMAHEVQPVTSGHRFTIAGWFTDHG
jgi:SM-20-related protein